MSKSFFFWSISLVVTAGAYAVSVSESIQQPSVRRSVIVCDRWQWVGGGATSYGCLYRPREATVAGGDVTDEVVSSLQKQINALEERVKKLERP